MSVRDNPAQNRYELAIGDHTAFASYRLRDGVITLLHTEVPGQLSGKGIGSQLARGALDDVRARGLKVVARCEFMAGFIGKHAEYSDLLYKQEAS
jgi:uncharacterized protein